MKHNYPGCVASVGLASVGLVALLYGPSSALAQTAPSSGTAANFPVLGSSTATNTLPAVTLDYNITIPIVKVMPNPCTGGFVLVNGTTTIAIRTLQSTDFTLQFAFASTGRGDDALADGTLVSDGTQGLPYQYSSQAAGDTNFPDGRPEDFMQTVTMTEFLTRAPGPNTPDEFLMNPTFELTFTNGIPAVPVLRAINVSCDR
jgi:hypothetical protein